MDQYIPNLELPDLSAGFSFNFEWAESPLFDEGFAKFLNDGIERIFNPVGKERVLTIIVPDEAAGWVTGMYGPAPFASGDDMALYFESCYVLDPALEPTIRDAEAKMSDPDPNV